jgi:hypothetical protein
VKEEEEFGKVALTNHIRRLLGKRNVGCLFEQGFIVKTHKKHTMKTTSATAATTSMDTAPNPNQRYKKSKTDKAHFEVKSERYKFVEHFKRLRQ